MQEEDKLETIMCGGQKSHAHEKRDNWLAFVQQKFRVDTSQVEEILDFVNSVHNKQRTVWPIEAYDSNLPEVADLDEVDEKM